jgi:hypothetical protein
MRVTFTCEKCGHEFPIEDVVMSSREEGGMRAWSVAWDMPCPNCAKLTFGPLTEEMVAEGLAVASLYGHGGTLEKKEHLHSIVVSGFRPEARFVLRLLAAADGGCLKGLVPRVDDGLTRTYLLNLAKKP